MQFEGNFVSFKFTEQIFFADLASIGHMPFGDGCFKNGFTHFGDQNLHASPLLQGDGLAIC